MANSADSNPPLSATDGISAFAGGIWFVITTPGAWFHAAVPMCIAILLACGLSGVGLKVAGLLADRYFPSDANGSTLQAWVVTVLLGLIFVFLAALLSLVLAQPLSGWALEAIARKQERVLTGDAPPELGMVQTLWISVRCSLFILTASLLTTTVLLAISLIFPPAAIVTVPLKFLTAGWFLGWDLVDYPLGLRGRGIRRRLRWARTHLTALTTFGVCWALVLVIPGMFLLLLPMGVAGATRLVVAGERGTLLEALPA